MRLDFRGTEFPPHDDRPEWQRPINYGWNFTLNADADLKKLLSLYEARGSAGFIGEEELLTAHLVRKALRRVRWENRLRIAKLVKSAFQRWLYGMIYPRYYQLKKKLKLVAEAEEQKQSVDLPKDT
jgi:hypothetical protein